MFPFVQTVPLRKSVVMEEILVFLIVEVFQQIKEEGMGGLEYLILKLLTK